MLDAIEGNLSNPKARANLARCFEDVGLAYAPRVGGYFRFASVTIRVAYVQSVSAGSVVPADNVLLMDLLGDVIDEGDDSTDSDGDSEVDVVGV